MSPLTSKLMGVAVFSVPQLETKIVILNVPFELIELITILFNIRIQSMFTF